MNSCRLDFSAQLNTQLRANLALVLESIRQVIFDRLRCKSRKRYISKCRSQKLQSIQVLLVIALAPKGRLRMSLQEPVCPLIEYELFASERLTDDPRRALSSALEQALGLLPIGRAHRLSLYFSFLVSTPDMPKLRVTSPIDAAIAFTWSSSFAHLIPPFT